MSRDDRGPVPQQSPPLCLVMLPAAIVLTLVAVVAHWLGTSRRQLLRAVALGVVMTGLMALIGAAGWRLWLYDLLLPALLGALLLLHLAASAVLTRPGVSRGGHPGRRAAVGVEGSPAAATPMPAAVADQGPPVPRGRHRRPFQLPLPAALVRQGRVRTAGRRTADAYARVARVQVSAGTPQMHTHGLAPAAWPCIGGVR